MAISREGFRGRSARLGWLAAGLVALALFACGRVERSGLEQPSAGGGSAAGSAGTGPGAGGTEPVAGSANGGAVAVSGDTGAAAGAASVAGATSVAGASASAGAADSAQGGAPDDEASFSDDSLLAWPMPNTVASGLPHPASYDTSSPDAIGDRVTGLQWSAYNKSAFTWADAVSYCAELDLAGHADWRLPSRIELVSLFAADAQGTADGALIPNLNFAYASASPDLASTVQSVQAVWRVDPYRLSVEVSYTNQPQVVRCVRTDVPPTGPKAQHIVAKGVVTDTGTGLHWQRDQRRLPFGTAAAAAQYCAELTLSGQSDWRVPSLAELSTIVDDTRLNPALSPNEFLGTYQWEWSSTPYQALEEGPAMNAYTRFADGQVSARGAMDAFVRCVR